MRLGWGESWGNGSLWRGRCGRGGLRWVAGVYGRGFLWCGLGRVGSGNRDRKDIVRLKRDTCKGRQRSGLMLVVARGSRGK